MEPYPARSNISYDEYWPIAQLVQAHVAEHGSRFRAMVAFGPLVTRGDTVDLDLLEVLEEWAGSRYWEFTRSPELRLRGRLRLHLLTPEEFEKPGVIRDPEERRWAEDLLRRVRHGYEVITEVPADYARAVLEGENPNSAPDPPPSGTGISGSPLHLTRKE